MLFTSVCSYRKWSNSEAVNGAEPEVPKLLARWSGRGYDGASPFSDRAFEGSNRAI